MLFIVTIFLSASLLFFVQPLFARIALPQIGGAPAVWTTAMLFFQSVLRYFGQEREVRRSGAAQVTFWAA